MTKKSSDAKNPAVAVTPSNPQALLSRIGCRCFGSHRTAPTFHESQPLIDTAIAEQKFSPKFGRTRSYTSLIDDPFASDTLISLRLPTGYSVRSTFVSHLVGARQSPIYFTFSQRRLSNLIAAELLFD